MVHLFIIAFTEALLQLVHKVKCIGSDGLTLARLYSQYCICMPITCSMTLLYFAESFPVEWWAPFGPPQGTKD